MLQWWMHSQSLLDIVGQSDRSHFAVTDGLPTDEFQKPIKLATPDLITLLNSKDDWNVRATVAKALATFANHSMSESIFCVTITNSSLQLNCMNPSSLPSLT
jgi:hypothetical protein